MARYIFTFLLLLTTFFHLRAQEFSIYGEVKRKNDLTYLIGCSVYNVTKQRGTVTNEEGRYRLSVDKGDLIQFTYIGMGAVEKYVLDSSTINVELEYQTRRIKNVTIKGELAARKSVLFNPKYDESKKKIWIEPVHRTSKEMLGQAGPKIGASGVTMSPISLLYYAFNKRERRRLDAIVDMDKLDASNLKYNLDFISLITKVQDVAELKDIKAYCYFPHDRVLDASFYDLGLMLESCYIDYLEYRKQHPLPVNLPATDSIPVDY